jgi:HEAT repeat protein
MGHEGVAVLLQAVTNQDYVLRSSAVLALGGVRSDFDKVVPALIEELKHDEISLLRGVAAADLIELHKQPDLVVPAFSEFLASPDASKRAWGATLLKGFGADAKAAIPLLLKERSDEDPDVRKAAEEALVKIAPETEAKAGL